MNWKEENDIVKLLSEWKTIFDIAKKLNRNQRKIKKKKKNIYKIKKNDFMNTEKSDFRNI